MFDGIMDINHNDAIDLSAAKAAGIVAVIHKATEGATFQDPLYASRRTEAKELGLLWGAYHFGTAADVTEQLRNFTQVAQIEPGDFVALDYEEKSGDQMTQEQAEQFVTLFQQQFGYVPLVYGSDLLKSVSASSPLAACGLWIAAYENVSQPALPPAYGSYKLWQYTDGTSPTPVQTAGVNVDRDGYDGTQGQLMAAWPLR